MSLKINKPSGQQWPSCLYFAFFSSASFPSNGFVDTSVQRLKQLSLITTSIIEDVKEGVIWQTDAESLPCGSTGGAFRPQHWFNVVKETTRRAEGWVGGCQSAHSLQQQSGSNCRPSTFMHKSDVFSSKCTKFILILTMAERV